MQALRAHVPLLYGKTVHAHDRPLYFLGPRRWLSSCYPPQQTPALFYPASTRGGPFTTRTDLQGVLERAAGLIWVRAAAARLAGWLMCRPTDTCQLLGAAWRTAGGRLGARVLVGHMGGGNTGGLGLKYCALMHRVSSTHLSKALPALRNQFRLLAAAHKCLPVGDGSHANRLPNKLSTPHIPPHATGCTASRSHRCWQDLELSFGVASLSLGRTAA